MEDDVLQFELCRFDLNGMIKTLAENSTFMAGYNRL